jgi:hypothetical protein
MCGMKGNDTMNIEVAVLDTDGCDTARIECETMKDAKRTMANMMDIHYWQTFFDAPMHTDSVHTIQIVKDGVVVCDKFPRF